MIKHHSNRLAYLMDSLGVTGRELATALHIDNSLVSKWRNNTRRLSNKSNNLRKAAEYLLSKDADGNYVHIRKALSSQYEDCQDASYATLLVYLERWLSESANVESYAPIISSDKSQNMYTAQFEAYRGNHGRRHAVLRFLDYVLTMPEGQQLLLLSQEDMSWMLGDAEFLTLWQKKLTEVVLRKNNITIIHTLDREFRDLTDILSKWLPLHMTGRLKSYFYPKYVDTSVKNTMFILQDSAAILGAHSNKDADNRYTGYFTDPWTLRQSELVYNTFLDQCRPLFTAHPIRPVEPMLKTLLELQEMHDNTYLYADLPTLTTMTEQTLKEVLIHSDVSEAAQTACINYHAASRSSFFEGVTTFKTRHIYNLAALHKGLFSDEPILSAELSLIAGKPVLLQPQHFSDVIAALLSYLEQYDNFSIGFSTTTIQAQLPHLSFWVQENGVVLSSTTRGQQYGPFAIVANEPTIVNAFYAFCENVWLSLPRVNREKALVIDKLNRLISS